MTSMSYCRFRNTLIDLKICYEHIEDSLSSEEDEARMKLIEICRNICDLHEG